MWILLSENLNKKNKTKWLFDFIDLKNIYVLFWIFLILVSLILISLFIFYKFLFLEKFNETVWLIWKYNELEVLLNWDWEKYKWLKFQEKFLKDAEKWVKIISENKQKDLVWKLNFALPDVLDK